MDEPRVDVSGCHARFRQMDHVGYQPDHGRLHQVGALDDPPLVDLGQRFGWKSPPLTSFRLRNLLADNYCDMTPIKQLLGDEPYALNEGVSITVRWMREAGLIPTAERQSA